MIVCAYNEARCLPACLYSLLAQTRSPDEIIVVDNASTDQTGAVARAVPGVRVVVEPVKGLVVAREAARLAATGDILAYVDADCRVPLQWLERVERRFRRRAAVVAVTGPYRFYDWDFTVRDRAVRTDVRPGSSTCRAAVLLVLGQSTQHPRRKLAVVPGTIDRALHRAHL